MHACFCVTDDTAEERDDRMRKLTEHIYCMDADAETDQPFVYYVAGRERSLLIDAGNSPENYRRLIRELQNTGLKEPDYCVLTHWHWDHTFGAIEAACPLIASEGTDRQLKCVMNWNWDETSVMKRLETGEDIEFTLRCMKKQYGDLTGIRIRLPEIVFAGRMTIGLGGITAHLETWDSPHTRDAVMIEIPEERVLIGGDAHYEDFYNGGVYDQRRLTAFAVRLKEMEFEMYLKGHDEPEISRVDLLKLLEEKCRGER